MKNPAGGEGVCRACMGHTLPREMNYKGREGKEQSERQKGQVDRLAEK